jgi:hypothetical protein
MKKNKKNQKFIYITLGVIALIYFFKKSKKTNIPGGSMPLTNLSLQANKLAAQKVQNLNFVPDMETMADEYAKDLKNCK